MKDYRISHTEERIARKYEEDVYRPGSYDDMLWKWEQDVLTYELDKLRSTLLTIEYLDFGCGTGRILAFLEKLVTHSVGVDLAEAMLTVARKKVTASELVLADITKQDALAGRSFDLITAFRVFLNSQPDLRDEMFRVLMPKLRDEHSRFIFNIHGNTWSHRLCTKIWFQFIRRKNLNTLSFLEVKHLAEKHGLSIIHWYGFGILPKIFYRIFGSNVMYVIDSLLSHVPFIKYVSYDMVFICKKTNLEFFEL